MQLLRLVSSSWTPHSGRVGPARTTQQAAAEAPLRRAQKAEGGNAEVTPRI